jgi:hypothetical protein
LKIIFRYIYPHFIIGYPRGLKGTDIPVGSRIIAVVDFFEAIRQKEWPFRTDIGYEDNYQRTDALQAKLAAIFCEPCI